VPVKVLFVCLGNICRSPTAHALFQARVNTEHLSDHIIVDSAGTGDWHIGCPPDKRAQKTALEHGYDMSHLQARVVIPEDFSEFDYILGMDKDNLIHLKAMKLSHYTGVLGLFLTEAGISAADEVPDPFYGDDAHFEQVIQLIHNAVDGLLLRIKTEHSL
jgi:protein-tyrosine phosphatase